MNSAGLLERAFQLSASGECKNIGDLERRLKGEGYEGVAAHLAGKSLRRQLAAGIKSALETSSQKVDRHAGAPVE